MRISQTFQKHREMWYKPQNARQTDRHTAAIAHSKNVYSRHVSCRSGITIMRGSKRSR